MIAGVTLGRRSFDVPCTIEIEHTWESLHAHVELDGVTVEPGDRVRVHGDRISVPYGERLVLRRIATVTKAGVAERLWVRLTGDFEIMHLLDVSFSGDEP